MDYATKEEIIEELVKIVFFREVGTKVERRAFKKAAYLLNQPLQNAFSHLDSLEEVGFIMAVEDCFDIEISDEEAGKVNTIYEITELVQRKLEIGKKWQ